MRKLRKACSNCNKRNGDSQFFVSQKMFIKILQLVEKCFRWQCLVLVKRKSFSTKMAKDVIFTKNCWKIFLNRKMEEVTNFLEPRNVEDIWNWYHTPRLHYWLSKKYSQSQAKAYVPPFQKNLSLSVNSPPCQVNYVLLKQL